MATGQPRLVLASASPRRRQLLRQAGFVFISKAPRIRENLTPGVSGERACVRLAVEKASAVVSSLRDARPTIVLAADTLVGVDGALLGKASGANHARRILRRLSGTTHRVVTGVCLWSLPSGRRRAFHVSTAVKMRPWLPTEIEAYLRSGEWKGKAGAYAIQESADRFVKSIRGSWTNVVGLPMERVVSELLLLGVKGASRPGKATDRATSGSRASRAERPRKTTRPRSSAQSPRSRARRRSA